MWEVTTGKGAASLTDLKNVTNVVDIKRGRKLMNSFSGDAYFEMDVKRPKDVYLEEQISNLENMVVISSKFVELLTNLTLENVEYLPVVINNHKGEIDSDSYSIVHATKIIDCIDPNSSLILYTTLHLQ